MSIHAMNHVWRYSQAHSGNLLVLLAIADHADDDGVAFPSIKGLAFKARMTERNVQYAIKDLQEAGELKVDYGAGPRGKNLFTILMGENFAPPSKCRGETHFTPKGETDFGVKPISPESSVVKALKDKPPEEPPIYTSESLKAATSDPPEKLSVDDLIDGWNEICGSEGLPKVTDKGRRNKELREKIRLRLREQPEPAFWQAVLNRVWRTPWMRGDGDRGWKCDLYYLVRNATNAVKIYERDCNE